MLYERQRVRVHAPDDDRVLLYGRDAVPHRTYVLAQQAADAPLLVDLRFTRAAIKTHGLIRPVVTDNVTPPAADALVPIHLRNDMFGLMVFRRIDRELQPDAN